MYAYVVASHGLPKINGCPPRYDLGYKRTKSTGYSHDSMKTNRSSRIPSGLIVDLSTIANMVEVGLRLASPNFLYSLNGHNVY